ncbi:MAG: hypothetical protein COA66_07725 [Arcobacter sp.]|nr:MAG: hypothetical protein COA66_07725 [Arcobacter sp.]
MKKDNIDKHFLINPYYYLKVLRYKSLLILFITLVSLIAGIFLSKNLIKPTYKATVKLIRYDKKISMPRDVPYKFQNFNYDTALQTIRTRKNLSEVIQVLNIDSTVEKLYSAFEIKRGRNSDIIEIRYSNKDIKKAVKGANVLSEIFLKNFYEVQNAATKEIYHYYAKEKNKIQKNIDLSLHKKEKFIKKHKVLSIKIQKEYKYKQLNEIDLSLIESKVAKKEFGSKVQEIQRSLKNIPFQVQLKYTVRSANIKNLENKKKELRKLKQRYTLLNPKVKKITDEILIMEKELFNKNNTKTIADETTFGNNPVVTALKIEEAKSKIGIISSYTRIKNLEKQQKIIQEEIKNLNYLEKRFKIIESNLSQNTDLMYKVTNRLNELKMALESSLEDFKFLEYATPPKYAQPTYRKAIILMFGFLGLSLSIASILLLEFFNDKIKESFDLEKRFKIEVLGTLLDEKETSNLNIKYSMQFFDTFINTCEEFDAPKTVIFGSDVSHTGKTFVIEKLMQLLSRQNKKVLFIQSISKNENETKNALLNDALFYEKHIDYSLLNKINDTVDKAYLLINQKNKYDLADVKSLQRFFKSLNESKYDYIFLEISNSQSNPFLFSSLASFSSFVCLICKYRVSNRKDLKELITTMRKKGIKNIKGVLNVIHKKYI